MLTNSPYKLENHTNVIQLIIKHIFKNRNVIEPLHLEKSLKNICGLSENPSNEYKNNEKFLNSNVVQ